MSEDDTVCDSFTVISIDSVLVYKKRYYLRVYLDSFAYKIINKWMTDYLDDYRFKDYILKLMY